MGYNRKTKGALVVDLLPRQSKGQTYPRISRETFCNILYVINDIYATYGIASFSSKIVINSRRVALFQIALHP